MYRYLDHGGMSAGIILDIHQATCSYPALYHLDLDEYRRIDLVNFMDDAVYASMALDGRKKK